MKSLINGKLFSVFAAIIISTLIACGSGGSSETPPPPNYTPVLDAPSGLSAVAVSSTQINLSWNDESDNENGFKIERKTSGGEYAEIAQVGANSGVFSDTGLTADTTYLYRVRAYNNDGNSAYSAEATAATLGTVPAAPSGLAAEAVSEEEIHLSWTDNSGNETGFSIERSPNGSTSWVEVATVNADEESYNDTGLDSNTPYYYRVRAYNGTGNSDYTASASATTSDVIPEAPTGLDAVTYSSSRIDLSWTDNSDNETGFRIERSPNGTTSWIEIDTVGADEISYSNTGLEHATTYYYRVRAYNAVGNSSYTNTDHDMTTDIPPVAPSELGLAVQNLEITLTWTDNSGNETGFRIYRSLNGTDFTNVHTVGAGVTTWKDTGLSPYTTYYYYVEAYNGLGSSGSSNTESASTTDVLPADPTALSATTQSSTQIRLEWTDNSNNETGFRVERSLDGVTFSPATTVGASVTSVVDSGLTPGTHYYYQVYAYNGVGDSVSPTSTADATTNSTPVRKLTVYLEVSGGRVIDASHPAYVKVFSDDACTNEIASRIVRNYDYNKVVFDNVGQSPVYVMGFHDADGDGSLDADENRAYYYSRYDTPANPVRIEENGERTISLLEFDEDEWMPECSSSSTINVTVNYTGSGTVDETHRIYAWGGDDLDDIFSFDTSESNYGSTGVNGNVISFNDHSCLYTNVVVYYDANGDGKVSDGEPYELYNNSGIGDSPETLTLGDGSVSNITVNFDDSRVIRTRSLTVTANYTGSLGTVSPTKPIYVILRGLTHSGPTENEESFEKGYAVITTNGSSATLTGIYTSEVMVWAYFDADGNGLDRGDPVIVYNGHDFGAGYTPVSIAPGETGAVTINLNDTFGFPFDDYEDEAHPRWQIDFNDSECEDCRLEVLGVFPEVGTHTIGQNGIYGVQFMSPDAPYEMCAYGGTITITSLNDGGNITGSFSLSDISDGYGTAPELTGTVSGTFSVPNDGSPGGTFTATGTVDNYAINDSVTGTNVFMRPRTLTVNVSNSPLPDGEYHCETALFSMTDMYHVVTLSEDVGTVTISGGSGSTTLYSYEGDDKTVSGKWYGLVTFLDNGRQSNTPDGSYHSTLVEFQYTGGWDYGSRNFSQWIQYVRNGELQSGMIRMQGTISNCPVGGVQIMRMYISPEDFNRTESAWPHNSSTVSVSGGSANFVFVGNGSLYTNEHYRYILFTDNDYNGFDAGDYYSVCEPAGMYDGSNPVSGLSFSSWAQYDDSGTAVYPVDVHGSIDNLSNWSGNYGLTISIRDTYRSLYVGSYSAKSYIDLTSGSGSLSAQAYYTMKTGVSYTYSMFYDENSNNIIDEGEYVAASVDDVFDGTSPVMGIDFDTWVQKIYGTEIGTDIIIEGTISGITIDDTTRYNLRLRYVSTNYGQWGYDGCGGNPWIDGSTIDVGSSPYAFEATNSGYMIVGKPYYYIMYLDSNSNWQPDPGEMRCILTNSGAGYAYDGSGTVTGLSFSSWSAIPE